LNKPLVFAVTAWFVACFALGMLAQDITHEHESPVLDKEQQKQWMMCGSAFKGLEEELETDFDWEFKWKACNKALDDLFSVTYNCPDCEKV